MTSQRLLTKPNKVMAESSQVNSESNVVARSCLTCQRNKGASQLAPAGLLQPFHFPTRNWASVPIDFVVKLPKSPCGNDTIINVVDRKSKQAHFIACPEPTAEDTANLYIDHIFLLHRLPQGIVSDRDSRFTGEFWTSLQRKLGWKLNFSISYHPESNGKDQPDDGRLPT